MNTNVIFSPNECTDLCQHSFRKFLLYGRKCLEKSAGKEGKRIRNVQLASMSLTNIRGFLKQQNKEEEKKQECNAQKIERLCEMTAQAIFYFCRRPLHPLSVLQKTLSVKRKPKASLRSPKYVLSARHFLSIF